MPNQTWSGRNSARSSTLAVSISARTSGDFGADLGAQDTEIGDRCEPVGRIGERILERLGHGLGLLVR